MNLKSSKVLVTGGTGTFGNAFLRRALSDGASKIIVFSRDEKKQFDMYHEFGDARVKYVVGDVRDINTLNRVMPDIDYVFHAAALKHVPSCEYNVLEAVKTNVFGTSNVLDSAVRHGVKKVVVLSTDKAVYPCNAMGASKMLAEKTAVEKARENRDTTICLVRFGNLVMSRGSAIPLFISQIKAGKPITVTDPQMTRFFMTTEDAIDTVMLAFSVGRTAELFIKKAPSFRLGDIVDALKQLFETENPVLIRGTRHGERLYESLLSEEECHYASYCELGTYIKVDRSFDAEQKPKGIPYFDSRDNVSRYEDVQDHIAEWCEV